MSVALGQEMPSRTLYVTIVADNPETLDGLHAYMERAGIATHGTRQLDNLLEMTPSTASAVVVFPDDFGWDVVLSALSAMRTERPKTLTVLVTGTPGRFEALPIVGTAAPPLVMPRPAWGWTILDAIRAGLSSRA